MIKVHDLGWLEFVKPDLKKAEVFALAFGFTVALRTEDELQLRGSDAGAPCVLVRRGERSRFVGPASVAADPVRPAAAGRGDRAHRGPLPESLGGMRLEPTDPSGIRSASSRASTSSGAGSPASPVFNVGHTRSSGSTRPSVRRGNRLGCSGSGTSWWKPPYRQALDWYLENLGPDRERLPVLRRAARARAGDELHPLRPRRHPRRPSHAGDDAGPANRYVHSAYQVADLDALAAGGEYLREHGYRRSWGIGRHIQGSQLFDYWRDPDGFMVEHFSDGDMFDRTVEPGWAP